MDMLLWPAVLLPALCEMTLTPHIPKLVQDFFGESSATASENLGYVDSVAAFLAFLSAGALGQASDSIGRKPLLIFASIGYLLPNLCLALTSNLWFYLGARALRGLIMGSSSAQGPNNVLSTVVADRSQPEMRSRRFGHMYALSCLASALSPAVVHIPWSQDTMFKVVAGMSGLNVLYVLLCIGESHRAENRVKSSSISPIPALRFLISNPQLRCLGFIAFFSFLPESGILDASLFYLKDKLGYTADTFSWLFFGFGVAGFISQSLVLSVLRRWVPDVQLLQVALVMATAHFMVYAVSFEAWMPFLAIALCAVYLVSSPALNGIVSACVDKKQQGLALGALASVKSLCAVFGPIMFTQLYAHFKGGPKCSSPCIADCKEMPFYVSTALESVGVVAAFVWLPKVTKAHMLDKTVREVGASFTGSEVDEEDGNPVTASKSDRGELGGLVSPRSESAVRFPSLSYA
eukprot:TRINITY_DN10006_c0_g1_i1.p1 TRINITY_DN10006_c0_g1~~TRINITY_DN10006_c0_g1_i1.p1  ORF type:complete len:463 (-),score=85.84 TRINITY_DN10006_c0_g1_i1:133-1521(-)